MRNKIQHHALHDANGSPGTLALWFCGDPHGSLRHILWHLEKAPAPERPVAIILLGDIEPPQPLEREIAPFLAAGVEVFWIRGNHDTDTETNWRNLQGSMNRCIDGQVANIAGYRIAGLGGVFRGDVWFPRATLNATPREISFESYETFRRDLHRKQGLGRRLEKMSNRAQAAPELAKLTDEIKNGKLRKHHSTIFPDVFRRMLKLRADILVTHEAPSPHPNGFEALDDLARTMGVSKVFHGHHHDNLPYPPAATYQMHGVGLRGISDQDGNVVKPGE